MKIRIHEESDGIYSLTCTECGWVHTYGPRDSIGKFFDAAGIHSMQKHKQKMVDGILGFVPAALLDETKQEG